VKYLARASHWPSWLQKAISASDLPQREATLAPDAPRYTSITALEIHLAAQCLPR